MSTLSTSAATPKKMHGRSDLETGQLVFQKLERCLMTGGYRVGDAVHVESVLDEYQRVVHGRIGIIVHLAYQLVIRAVQIARFLQKPFRHVHDPEPRRVGRDTAIGRHEVYELRRLSGADDQQVVLFVQQHNFNPAAWPQPVRVSKRIVENDFVRVRV